MDVLFSDEKGNLADFPGLLTLGRRGGSLVEPGNKDMILLPQGASLTLVPGRLAVGLNPETGGAEALEFDPYQEKKKKVYAVAALLPQGYTRTFLPAWMASQKAPALQLMGFTAVGSLNGKIYCAAIKTDEDKNWNPQHFNKPDLERRVADILQKYPTNRIIKQLANCSLEYACFTAQNIFYQRWEGGIPVSPTCNANCLGCISLQPADCCPSPQQRIKFVPQVQEILELTELHLANKPNNIISFGQGCEGEPSLQAEVISEAITLLRQKVPHGTININTNAGYTEGITKIIASGLNHARVSLISAIPETYNAYYNPQGYSIEDVKASLAKLAEKKVFTALNLLTFPGLTDRQEELTALIKLVNDYGIRQVQFRNLNYDPDLLFKILPSDKASLGVYSMLKILKKECPNTTFGSYTHPIVRR